MWYPCKRDRCHVSATVTRLSGVNKGSKKTGGEEDIEIISTAHEIHYVLSGGRDSDSDSKSHRFQKRRDGELFTEQTLEGSYGFRLGDSHEEVHEILA